MILGVLTLILREDSPYTGECEGLSQKFCADRCFLFSPCDRPRVIESLRGIEVVDIAAGGAHSACITAAGDLFTWGKGRYGRLGHGDSEDQLKPKLVRNLGVLNSLSPVNIF